MIISGWMWLWLCVHSWQLYSAAPLTDHATGTITWYPTQSHYPDTELPSPCPILLMPSARLCSDKYQFDKFLVWLSPHSNSRPSTQEAFTVPIRPQDPVSKPLVKLPLQYGRPPRSLMVFGGSADDDTRGSCWGVTRPCCPSLTATEIYVRCNALCVYYLKME